MSAGTIAILTHDTGRWSRFWECVTSLKYPAGTKIVSFYGADIARARNGAILAAEGDWVWFLDDDHTFGSDTLERLLAHDVDIVQPIVLRRYSPFLPVAQRLEAGTLMGQTLEDLGPGGLVPVDALGMGGTLIRRRVWETLERPWFRSGEIRPDTVGEDVGFCQRAQRAGCRAWVDLETAIGHLAPVEVWPIREDGRWRVALRVGPLEVVTPSVTRDAPRRAPDV